MGWYLKSRSARDMVLAFGQPRRRRRRIVANHKRMRLLIVEDEADLLASLAKALREKGYAVDSRRRGDFSWA
jgi:hypothetical protein